MGNIFKRCYTFSLVIFITIVFVGCDSGDKESMRDRTVRLLAGDSYKQWIVKEVFENGVTQSISLCDSAYILTMKTDFSWTESYLSLQCPQSTEGSWSLNEDNTVITIEYISWQSGTEIEQKFMIVDLTNDQFAYEVVSGNNLKIIHLKSQ